MQIKIYGILKLFGLSVLCLFFFQSCSAPRASMGSSIGKKVYKAVSEEDFDGHYYGLYIMDAADGTVLYDEGGHNQFTPASVTKLFTYYISQSLLPANMPFVDYVIDSDTAIIWPYGNPEFIHPSFSPAHNLVDSLKNLAPVLYFSNAQYRDKQFGEGWAWDDYIYAFQPEKSFLPVHGNIVEFTLVDKQKHHIDVWPSYYENWLSYRPSIGGKKFYVERAPFANAFDYNISTGAQDGVKVEIPISSDRYSLGRFLQTTLQKDVAIKSIPLADYGLKSTIYGIKSDSLYRYMLLESDNLIAEQLLLSISYILSDTMKTDIATTFAADRLWTFLPDDFQYVDGSGLSRYNQNTPANAVSLLRMLYKNDYEKIKAFLPKGDLSGISISEGFWHKNTSTEMAAHMNVFAKSGTMKNVYNLAGYIETKSGKVICFSWMNNHFSGSRINLETEMLQVLKLIYEAY